MAKHYTTNKAICPFYKHESRQMIYCEGIKKGNVLHLAFDNPANCLEHKKKYCRCNYSQCSLHSMLDRKYNKKTRL